jgi:uncharacterized membrane protein
MHAWSDPPQTSRDVSCVFSKQRRRQGEVRICVVVAIVHMCVFGAIAYIFVWGLLSIFVLWGLLSIFVLWGLLSILLHYIKHL